MKEMYFSIGVRDREEFEVYLKGPTYYGILCEIMQELRAKVKYTDEKGSWVEAYKLVIAILNEENVEL